MQIRTIRAAISGTIAIVATGAALASGYVSKVTMPNGEVKMIKDAEARIAITELVDRVNGAERELPSMVSNLVDNALSPQAFSVRIISDNKVEGSDLILTDHVMNYVSWEAIDGVSLGKDTHLVVDNRTVTGKHNYSVLIDKMPEAALFEDFPVQINLDYLVGDGYKIYCNYPMDEDNVVMMSTTNLPLIVQFDEPSPSVIVATIREMR